MYFRLRCTQHNGIFAILLHGYTYIAIDHFYFLGACEEDLVIVFNG
jgi:hypothetical protein